MPTNREYTQRGARQRARRQEIGQAQLNRRRAEMQEAEGHAGSIPRGYQRPEDESLGHHRNEYERLLGH
jgi:hypothetical protein